MEKATEGILMKNRSYNSSLTAGYKLYTDNFKKILKASWLWAVLYAAACSILGTLSSIELPRFVLMTMASTSSEMPLYENPEYITICLSFLAVIIIGGIIEITFYSSGVSLLRQHQENASIPVPNTWFYFDKSSVWRTIKAAFFYFIIALIISIPFGLIFVFFLKDMLADPSNYILSLCITGLAILLIVCLAIPLTFSCTKYLLSHKGNFWKILVQAYPTGFRHYGYIFVVSIVCMFIVFIVSFITSLPAYILSEANYIANIGLLQGDPLGMPDYITTLTIITFFVCGFIQAYIRMTMLFPTYYMYGAIETQEKEILENKLKNEQDLYRIN